MNDRLWLIGLLLPAMATAQVDSLTIAAKAPSHVLVLEASAGFDSNVIFNDLVLDLYRGRNLSREVRDRSYDALGNANRGGYLLDMNLAYTWGRWLLGRDKWRPRINVAYRSQLGLRFSRDAFALAFRGNKAFEGRAASIGPGTFQHVAYQEIGFGVEDHASGSFLAVSLVGGNRLRKAVINQADLYTATDGRFVELDLDGNYRRSDTSTVFKPKGIGAALSFSWRHPVHAAGQEMVVTVGAEDIGFISWGRGAGTIGKDTLIRYDGFTAQSILDLDGLIPEEENLRDSLGLGYTPGSFVTLLPGLVHARLEFGKARRGIGHVEHRAYSLSVAHRFSPGFVPCVSAVRHVALSRALSLGAGVGYGGYGGFRLGLGLEARLGKQVALTVGTDNAVGLVSSRSRGMALATRLEMAW